MYLLSAERLNVLYERNWTRLVHEQLRKFESSIVAAAKQSSDAQPPELVIDSKWTFSGALIYCITLITTIGKMLLLLAIFWVQTFKTFKRASFSISVEFLIIVHFSNHFNKIILWYVMFTIESINRSDRY